MKLTLKRLEKLALAAKDPFIDISIRIYYSGSDKDTEIVRDFLEQCTPQNILSVINEIRKKHGNKTI